MTDTQKKKRSEFIHNAVDYIDELKGDDWQVGGGFASGDSVLVCGSNGEGDFGIPIFTASLHIANSCFSFIVKSPLLPFSALRCLMYIV